MVQKNNKNNNEVLLHSAKNAIDQIKYEIAQEFVVQLGPNTTSRANGSVGGEITKRLVQNAQMNFEYFTRGDEQDSHNPSSGSGGTGGYGDGRGPISASDVLSRMNGGQRPTER